MSRTTAVRVRNRDGLGGTVENPMDLDRPGAAILVRLDDGRHLRVPSELVIARDDGYELALNASAIDRAAADAAARGGDAGEAIVIPVVAEALDVRTRRVETGRVRVRKLVREHEEIVDPPLVREEVEVRRVAVGRFVDREHPPAVRTEGDVTIVPVLEEVPVVETRLRLKEELHIIRRRVEEHRPQRVTLREEEVRVERPEGDGPAADGSRT